MRARDYPYFDTRFAALAHRGGHGGAVPPVLENSMAAFANAVGLGYRYLESDVHATSDGVLVAFHDPDLERATGRPGRVRDLPWSQVRTALIGGTEPIPRLDDLLDAFPDGRFNLDLKADDAVGPLVRAIARHGAADRVCVGSFSRRRIAAFRALAGPAVPTAASPAGVGWYGYGLLVRRLRPSRGVALQVPVRTPRGNLPLVTAPFVRAAHRAGRVVHVWTINDADEMRRLIDLGVDGLVSDDLVALRSVLRERGLWEESP